MANPGKLYNSKGEKFFTYLALIISLASILAVISAMHTAIHMGLTQKVLMHSALIGEGLFLLLILFLYVSQLIKIKKINAEKDQALSLLKNRMAAIEAAADGIGIVGPDGALVYMNSALQNLHGIPPEEVDQYIGFDWLNLYTEAGRMEVEQEILPQLAKTGNWRGKSHILRNDKKVIVAELTLTRLPDNSMIGTARDISEKQRASKEKQTLEQQFYQAQKMEAIGRLAGGIAHDFNNILAAISGYAEFLDEDLKQGSPEQKFAKNILKAGAQAKELVDQMLAFSRQRQSTKEPLGLLEPMMETLSMVKSGFPKTIEVQTDFSEDELYIDGNATQISQLIMNLCVNARDAMEDDRGMLSVSLRPANDAELDIAEIATDTLPEPGQTPDIFFEDVSATKTRMYIGRIAKDTDYVVMSIADTGSGMSRAIMEHIFEPFFTTKSMDKGTGLGLATVHGVITGHQGALIIESDLGSGTCFKVLLPATHELRKVKLPDAPAIEEQIQARILFVEDQDEVKIMMSAMLDRLGHSVDTCPNGLDALAVIKDKPGHYDLILSDHNMPKMTGIELAQQAYYVDPSLPFILVSGYSRERLQEMMKDHPSIKSILRKPVSRKTLGDTISRVLIEKRDGLAGEDKKAAKA